MFDINVPTFVIFLAMFLTYIAALNALVLKPIGAAMERRQAKIKGDIEAGSAARARAAEAVEDYEKHMHETRAKAQSMVNDVLGIAQEQRQTELKRIHDEGQARLHAAKQAVAAERSVLIGHLAEEQKSLVGTIVNKLLGDNVPVFVDTDKARQVLVEEAS